MTPSAPSSQTKYLFLLFFITCLLLAFTGQVWAQSGRAKPSQAQLDKNDQALDAMEKGRFEQAWSLWSEALQNGEFNLFRLNQGRALQRMGRCDEAKVAYRKALRAPAVQEPSPEAIAKALARYQSTEEMGRLCPGKLIITCQPGDMSVAIDGAPSIPCPRKSLVLSPGPHKLRGEAFDDAIEQLIEVRGDDVTEINLVIAPPAARAQAETLFASAQQALQAKQTEQAIDQLTQAAQLAPNWGQPAAQLGQLTQDTNPGAALKWYSQYLPFTRDAERTRVSLVIKNLEGDLQQQQEALQQAQAREAARQRYQAQLAQARQEVNQERWWWLGGAAIALGAGLAVDLIPDSGDNYAVDALDFVPLFFYSASLASAIWALMLDAEVDPPPELQSLRAPFDPVDVQHFYLGQTSGWTSPFQAPITTP